MASSPTVATTDRGLNDSPRTFWTRYRKLGLLNGLLIGLALALGVWLPQVVAFAGASAAFFSYASILVTALLVVALGALTGYLTALVQKGWATFILWLATATFMSSLITHQPARIQTILVWFAEPGLNGLPIYPASPAVVRSALLSNLFVYLVLIILALVQEYRLTNIQSERRANGSLTISGWRQLLWPLVFVAAAGFAPSDVNKVQNASPALQLVDEAISTAIRYEGDLFQLGREEGLNYAALEGVRQQLGDEYKLAVSDVNFETGMTIVVAHFKNGAWIDCRVIYDQLNYCYDASPPYRIGFKHLVTGEAVPETCDGCLPVASEKWSDWLAERGARLGTDVEVEFQAQWGKYVLMRAASPSTGSAIECWFEGVDPIRLRSCTEIRR